MFGKTKKTEIEQLREEIRFCRQEVLTVHALVSDLSPKISEIILRLKESDQGYLTTLSKLEDVKKLINSHVNTPGNRYY